MCQSCGRPHDTIVRCLPDGRWFDPAQGTWRDRRSGRPARWPDLEQLVRLRTTRVVLAAAHLDHDPTNNRLRNLRSLCQRCHMNHDRPHIWRSGGSPIYSAARWATRFSVHIWVRAKALAGYSER
jgi:hypothetical protein